MTDPRIHERRVLVARQIGRRRRRRLLGLLAVVALVAGGFAVVHSSLLGARHVHVSGARHTARGAIIQAAGLSGAPPLVDVDAAAVARRVERLPWVATARVSIAWPSSVAISITERVPVAALPLPTAGFAICDPTGRVLEDVVTRPPSLPLVMGVARVGPPGSHLPASAAELTAVAGSLPESMVPRTMAIRPSSAGVEVDFSSGLVALIGGTGSLSQKFVALATVLAHGGLSGVGTVDVRVPTAPVLIRKASSPIVPGIGGG